MRRKYWLQNDKPLKVIPRPPSKETRKPLRIKYLIGVDVSITRTGIGILDNMGKLVASTDITPKVKTTIDHTRIDDLVGQFFDFVNPYLEKTDTGSVKFVFEAYAFSRAQGKMFSRAELTGILKHDLRKSDYDIIAVAPTAVKKAILGKGKFEDPKRAVMDVLYKRYNIYTQNADEADAIACALYGYKVFIEHEALPITRQTSFNPKLHG